MSNNQRKLKNLLINPKFQLRYVVFTTMWGLILVLINAFIFYHFISENYEVFIELNDITDEAKKVLYQELYQIIYILISSSIIFLIIIGLFGIVLSHRIAGPMYKFRKTFKEIKEGNTNLRIHLRPNDSFKEVASEFNTMMDSLVKKQ